MFNRKKKKSSLNNSLDNLAQTILGEGVTIKDGNLYGSNDVTISGVFFGDIDIEGILIVTESGNLRGKVKVDEVHVYGTIEGSITAKGKVHIYSESSVISDILGSASIVIEEGAAFKGQCNTIALQATNILNISGNILKHPETTVHEEPDATRYSKNE